MIDIGRALKAAISTGKVEFGVDQTEKAVKAGKAQLVIVSRNCPSSTLTAGDLGVKVHVYEGNNMELGALCGKPFSVSALAVIDKGTLDALNCGDFEVVENLIMKMEYPLISLHLRLAGFPSFH